MEHWPTGEETEHSTTERTVRIDITWSSLLRIFLAISLVGIVLALWPMIELLILAILVAVALYPIVRWSENRNLPRLAGLIAASAILLATAVGFFAFLGPMLLKQTAAAIENVPQLKEELLNHLPDHGPINRMAKEALNTVAGAKPLVAKALDLGKTALIGVVDFGLIIVLAIYLMADGPRLLRWVIVFFPARHRPNISEAVSDMAGRIVAYIIGQFITSVLAGIYVLVMLSIFHVPNALLLGVVAAVFDILPIVGFFLAVLPAMAMGLTVSSTTAIMVFVLYGAYHLFENYVIVPRVYGNELELSTLAVLLAIMAGGLLAGVPGAVAILPFVAAYPAVERLFLAEKLAPDTVRKHEQLSATAK
jgi:predicted PurR-regulated permease PerM